MAKAFLFRTRNAINSATSCADNVGLSMSKFGLSSGLDESSSASSGNGIMSLKSSLSSTCAWSSGLTCKTTSESRSKKSIISVTSFKTIFLAIAITQPAGNEIGVSVSFVNRQTVDCDDTTAIGNSNPGARRVNEEIGSTSIHAV